MSACGCGEAPTFFHTGAGSRVAVTIVGEIHEMPNSSGFVVITDASTAKLTPGDPQISIFDLHELPILKQGAPK